MPLPTSRTLAAAALAALALGLPGCYMPAPVTHAVLVVSETGTYTLDQQSVPGPELASVLVARHAATPQLRLDLQASPQASMQAIAFAVAAARQAQVTVDFRHDTPASAPH